MGLAALLAGLTACSAVEGSRQPASLTSYAQDTHFPYPGTSGFQNVSWLAVAPSGKEFYLLQRGKPAVSVWSMTGGHLRDWDTDTLGDPHSLSIQRLPDGNERIWITDMAPPRTAGAGYGHCLKQYTANGELLRTIGVCGPASQGSGLDPVQFDKVTDIGFDDHGYLWVTDGDVNGLNNRVLQLTQDGQILQRWSAPGNKPGSGTGQFNLPHAIDVDGCQRVWIADALNHRVQVFRTDGSFLQQLQCFGQDGVYGVRVRPTPAEGMQLYTSSSPTSNPTGGTVRVFDVTAQCSAPVPVPAGCMTTAQWPVALPAGSSVAMLHMIDASPDGRFLYIAPLGGDLAPQRWVRVTPRGDGSAFR